MFTPPAIATRPNSASTGVASATSLRRRAAGTVAENGATIKNALITGDLILSGRNQTVRNTRVKGQVLVTGSGTTIEDSEMDALSVSGAKDVTARRLEVVGALGADGIHVTSDTGRVANVLIEDSWIHSPRVSAKSHYDGIQVRGVRNLTLRGNYFDLGPHNPNLNSSVFTEQANGGNFNITIEGNWIDGGGYALYLGGTGVTVTDNKFGPNAPYGLLYPAPLPARFIQHDNMLADSGRPVTLQ